MTEEEYHQHFQEVALNAAHKLPASQLHGFGVSKNDLIELEFGGPNAGRIAETIRRGMKTEDAAWNRPDFSQKHEQFGDNGTHKRPSGF